jgi:putative ABC transport system permease protein
VIGELILRNVMHRPLRTTIGVLAVGVEVMLVVVIVGLSTGMLQETAKRIEGVGADILLQPPSASVFLAFGGAPMPIRIRERLLEIRDVAAVAPVLLQSDTHGGVNVLYGIEPESFNAVTGGFVFHEGRDLVGGEGRREVLVDDYYARARDLHAGGTVTVLGHEFTVAGIVEHGKGARVFAPIETLQELSGAPDRASIFFLKCRRPEQTEQVMAELREIFPRHEIRPVRELVSMMAPSRLPALQVFLVSMISLAVVIGFLVILLSTYTTIIERTREIGVLKSLGASKAYIIRAILSETLLVCLAGIAAGLGMSYLARWVLLSLFPTLTVLITAEWVLWAAAIALGAGLAGAAWPAWLASRRDAIEALAYE